MPSKSYGRFIRNLETVTRLQDSYDIIRAHRGSRGKGRLITLLEVLSYF